MDRGNRSTKGIASARVLLTALTIIVATPCGAVPIVSDNFNRIDGAVGNGWTNTTGNINGSLVIRNGELTASNPDGGAGIYRPIDLSAPLKVSATIKDTNGADGRLRYDTGFSFKNDGSYRSGYGLYFSRSDLAYNNSTVYVSDNAGTLNSFTVPFQFGAEIATTFTWKPDNSISGTVTSDGNTASFSFLAHGFSGTGSNFAISSGFGDGSVSPRIDPRIDDLTISTGNVTPSPPDTLTLARFADLAYPNTSEKVPEGYEPLKSSTGLPYELTTSVGRMIAYTNGTDIVVAFKGTELSNPKDVLSDSSWSKPYTPSPQFRKYVREAAAFLDNIVIANADFNYRIQITGHSLGGAVAQLLGDASGLRTETFNAPGTEQLRDNLSDELRALTTEKRDPPFDIVNHRVYGDVVSYAGPPIGAVVTHDSPAGEISLARCNSVCGLRFSHKIATVLTSLQIDPSGTPGFREGTNGVVGRVLLLAVGEVLGFEARRASYYALDPEALYGQDFSLLPGSPLFRSVVFGYASDFLYELDLYGDSGWNSVGNFSPGDEYFFDGGGAERFRVLGNLCTASSHSITIPIV